MVIASCALAESGSDQLGVDSLDWPEHVRWSPGHARWLTTRLLRGLPNRMAHSLLAGVQARRVRATVPVADADLLVSAGMGDAGRPREREGPEDERTESRRARSGRRD